MRTSEGGERDAVFRFGEFTFDCGSHLLRRGDDEQRLSPKARQLLRLLLLNRSRAMSRKELYDALWPETYVCETNLATVISELRRVLDDEKSTCYIRTVHGFGYAFAGDVITRPKAIPVALLLCEDQRHPLYDGENSVGRSQDCNVILSGATVSRHHAVIVVTSGGITINDLQSKNGTYVKGRKISQAEIELQEPIMFGAVQATIIRKISSTLPFQVPVPQRRHSGPVQTS